MKFKLSIEETGRLTFLLKLVVLQFTWSHYENLKNNISIGKLLNYMKWKKGQATLSYLYKTTSKIDLISIIIKYYIIISNSIFVNMQIDKYIKLNRLGIKQDISKSLSANIELHNFGNNDIFNYNNMYLAIQN